MWKVSYVLVFKNCSFFICCFKHCVHSFQKKWPVWDFLGACLEKTNYLGRSISAANTTTLNDVPEDECCQ